MMKLGDILTVDLSRESVERKPFPSELARRYLGGRGINTYWLCSEKGTGEDDFSPDNVLVMSCGLLTGTHVPASARLHISAKSPLTGGLGSSIAFAMEAFEKEDITPAQTDGMEIHWGDQVVMEQLIEQIAHRRGFGDILAEGVARASQKIGRDSPGMPITAKAWI